MLREVCFGWDVHLYHLTINSVFSFFRLSLPPQSFTIFLRVMRFNCFNNRTFSASSVKPLRLRIDLVNYLFFFSLFFFSYIPPGKFSGGGLRGKLSGGSARSNLSVEIPSHSISFLRLRVVWGSGRPKASPSKLSAGPFPTKVFRSQLFGEGGFFKVRCPLISEMPLNVDSPGSDLLVV